MAPPKGNKNAIANWVGQFEPAVEPKVKIDSKVPKSTAEEFLAVLESGESKSAGVVKAIELFIKYREAEINQKFLAVLKAGESESEALVKAIELFIKSREAEAN
ncbi:hypothetical protein QUA43_30030 [Microcoleus sp. N9_B4]|uniref:hypothetical protein n=1 Tax=Microcoleus sp. N9_B4 TaxID=3055386 RepID=UPI002FCE96BB